MQWSQAFRPCALAAVVASLLMALGLNPFVAMFSVGFLAVVFYRQSRREILIETGNWRRVGCIGRAALVRDVVHSRSAGGDPLSQRAGAAAVSSSRESSKRRRKPATRRCWPMFDRLKSPGGLELLMLTGLIFALLASLVLGGLGGLLGGAILGRRDKG